MKKTCIALIVLVALLSMLAACGKQADDPAGADGRDNFCKRQWYSVPC